MALTRIGNKSIDKGLAELGNLVEKVTVIHPDWNEADTRFQFIDPFITDCLGWHRDEIRVEAAHGGTYTDYELGKPRVAIWEAKREGTYFELPANPARKLVAPLSSVMALDDNAAAAIKQVQAYCSSRGAPIAVLCNGHQIIAFLAVRLDGHPPLEGKCLVVDGYQQMLKEFPLLWQNLSPEGVTQRRIVRLLTTGETGIPRKLSSYLMQYPTFRYKSRIQADLRAVAELLIEDVVKTPEVEEQFYRKCYCESGSLAHDALLSKQLLAARYAALFKPTEPTPSVTPVKPTKGETTLTPEVMAEALARRPIVLIGDVGVGKTSFLKHLMYVSAFDEFQRAVYIYIDLGSQAALERDMKAFVISEIERQLRDRYTINIYEANFVRGVYNRDLNMFRQGIYGALYDSDRVAYDRKLLDFLDERISNKAEHLRNAIQHVVAGRQKQVVLMIDNADQRNLDVQQEAFLVAQNFAQSWKAAVFISVRPQTFHQSKHAGVFAAYPQKIFSISPPRADIVVEKRLHFALEMAEGRLPIERLQGVTLNFESLALFLKALLHSLRYNSDLVELLTNITGGNIRQVIDLIVKFIGSPNVDAQKIIKIMEKQGSYRVPIHEFTKSALLGEYAHYEPSSSLAMNLFDVRYPDEREHFLPSMVVAFLSYDGTHRNREGFVTSSDVIAEMQNWGFTSDQIESVLRRLTNKRLIETTERVTFEEDITGLIGDMPAAFRITTVGVYHLSRWATTFAYLDAMVFDTPIFNSAVMDQLTGDPDSFEIRSRLHRATAFRAYLSAAWHKSGLTPHYFDWSALVPTGEHSFQLVATASAKPR